MKQKRMNFCFFALIPMILFYTFSIKPHIVHQISRTAIAGDTSAFIPNHQGGWGIYMSYLNQDTKDTVEFELVVQHNNNIDWKNEQFIGVISKNSFRPKTTQRLTYQLLIDSIWNVRVEPNGQCFLSLASGSAAFDDPAIFPVNVRFKNN